MEASALHAPALSRLSLSSPLLRLRSDEQLLALFRAGSDEAFSVIHDRYRQRLFAYARQMLSSSSRQDAEDVLQDVFVRAYGALRNDERDVNLRAWLYRVAHNRCIDHLRRPTPPAAEIFEMSRTPLQDPMETAQRREDLKRLVEDVGRLPDQQRSALLMREIDGMAYAHIADALEVTVPAVKSLLVRARVGLVEAGAARNTDCAEIRTDLAAAYDRGVKASGRARKHMRECSSCRDYRTSLRTMRKSFAALSPIGFAGPLALAAKTLGIGGAGGGGAAAAGTAGTVATTATACKVAAVVCATAITAGGAVEVKRLAIDKPASKSAAAKQSSSHGRVQSTTLSSAASAPVGAAVIEHRTQGAGPAVERAPVTETTANAAPAVAGGIVEGDLGAAVDAVGGALAPSTTGGAIAPVDDSASAVTTKPGSSPGSQGTSRGNSGKTESGTGGSSAGAGTTAPPADAEPAPAAGGSSGQDGPPAEH